MPTPGNSINESTTGICGFTGTAFTGTAVTQHAVIVGGSTSSTLTNIAATANTGAVLQNNSGADPSYSTATYPSTTTINQVLYSSAANTVTGLATANGGVFDTTSSGVPQVDTTNFSVLSTGVQVKGNNTNTAPPAGFIGEQIRSATSVALTSTVLANITSISLTAGIWDISAIASVQPSVSVTNMNLGISVNSASFTGVVFPDSGTQLAVPASTLLSQSIPSFRATLSGTTTYFLVVSAIFSGTASGAGRISATRVG